MRQGPSGLIHALRRAGAGTLPLAAGQLYDLERRGLSTLNDDLLVGATKLDPALWGRSSLW